jgi:nitroreductase
MNPVSPDDVLEPLRWRYATKTFDPARKIPADVWAKLEDALVLSPSSYGLQPWRFVVVTDPAVRAKLRPAAWNQPQITDASHLVVFAARRQLTAADVDALIGRTSEVRGVPAAALDGYRQMMLGSVGRNSEHDNHAWAARQAYIALGVFLATAAAVGVDACPMEGFEGPKFDDILGLPAKGYGAVVLAAAGYRSADDKTAGLPKVRFPKERVIEHV